MHIITIKTEIEECKDEILEVLETAEHQCDIVAPFDVHTAEVDEQCLQGGDHFMVQPEDSKLIKWGTFGVCRVCHTIKPMP